MSTTVTQALISALAGVGGALVGSGVTLLAGWRAHKAELRRNHDDAILGFWTATANWGSLWNITAKVLPADSNLVDRTLQGLRLGSYGHQLVDRQFAVSDAFWHAMGRVRIVALASELRVVNAVENAVGDWTFGNPMPQSFEKAIGDLRVLVESLGPEGATLVAEGPTT